MVHKVPVTYHSLNNEAMVSYMQYLTPYAYQFVAKQMELKEKVQLQNEGNNTFESWSSEDLIMVTSSTCECISWMSMKLPCRHILVARSKLDLGLYDESLCSKRWSVAYYKLNQRIFLSGKETNDNPLQIVHVSSPKRRTMSQVHIHNSTCKWIWITLFIRVYLGCTPLPCFIRPTQLSCLGSSVGRVSA